MQIERRPADHWAVRRALLVLALAVLFAAPARADVLLPPPGKVFAGLTGGLSVDAFSAQVGKHPPVFQFFTNYGASVGYIFDRARTAGSRPMLHVSTMAPNGREVVTPAQIAAGAEDGWLVSLNHAIAANGPTYVRLMAEMDGHWNAYCAYGPDGRPRGGGHSTAAFRSAWRRTVIIVRGRDVAAGLRAAGLTPLRAGSVQPAQVAFLWVPQVAGAPDVAANAPRAYWPGGGYVDWVGTDFYAKFPNFAGLEAFYGEFSGKPFAFGEWALWGSDDPAFVHQLFSWTRTHPRVRMLVYNQGNNGAGPFRLKRYPRARRALAQELSSGRFPAVP